MHDSPGPGRLPYLGLVSRSRRTELAPFTLRWAGGWIDYAEEELRERGNALPPLSNFQRPKVIYNQHDRRMTAWADLEGRFVSKDVYPIAWPISPDWTVLGLTALLNSTVFTALYNTLMQGIVVGGETYHYLPAFLRTIPVPDPLDVDERVRALQEAPDGRGWLVVDRCVTAAYGLSESTRVQLAETHLARVGAPYPGSEAVNPDTNARPPRSVR